MAIHLFNPYPIRVPVIAENPTTKESYMLSVLPKTKAELLEGYVISATTYASSPKIIILNSVETELAPETDEKKKGK